MHERKFKQLNEFVTTALTTGMLAVSGFSLLLSVLRNGRNKKLMYQFHVELYRAKTRQQANAVVDKYTNTLKTITQQTLSVQQNARQQKGVVNKFKNLRQINALNKIRQTHNYIDSTFTVPLKRIINNQSDQNWRNRMLNYVSQERKRFGRKTAINTTLNAVSLAGVGAAVAGTGGVAGAALIAARTPIFVYRQVIRQLNFFNGQRHINKMIKELNACPDNDRQQALEILQRYSFNISSEINSNIQKTKKSIPINIQEQIRNVFYKPLANIIQRDQSKHWKMILMDELKTNNTQNKIQHVCQTTTMYLSRMFRNSTINAHHNQPQTIKTAL